MATARTGTAMVPGPSRYRWLTVARVLIAGVAAAGAVTASFLFLTELARATGWHGGTAFLLPLSVDALAAAAWLSYATGTGGFAARVGAGATAASLLGNAASHWFGTGLLVPGWVAVTLVGSAPAVSLMLVVRLMTPPRPVKGTAKVAENSDAPTFVAASTSRSNGTGPAVAASPASAGAGGGAGGPGGVGSAALAPVAAGTAPQPAKPRRAAKRVAPNGRARSDAERLAEIRARGLEGESLNTWARELQVSKTTAQQLRRQFEAAGSNGHTDGRTP